MHDTNCNADTHRDHWIPHARRFNFLILAPCFPERKFSSRGDHRSNMQDENGRFQPERLWTFTVIDSIFQYVRRTLQLTVDHYALYGHSAGGQLVHRYTLFRSSTYADMLIAANAGWYTMPRWDIEYPYGLGGSPLDRVTELARAFSRRLIILLDEEDTDPNDPYLNTARRVPTDWPADATSSGRHDVWPIRWQSPSAGDCRRCPGSVTAIGAYRGRPPSSLPFRRTRSCNAAIDYPRSRRQRARPTKRSRSPVGKRSSTVFTTPRVKRVRRL